MGVHFAIRDFQADDFDTLWRIDQVCFPAGISYSRAELRFYMRRRASFALVAESVWNGEDAVSGTGQGGSSPASVAGFSVVGFIVAEGPGARGHIITIDVLAPARRSGVGSLLLRAAEERLVRLKCAAVDLETAVDNISALAFYKRHGYSVIRTSPRYYSNGVDALVMEKRLSS
jgi:[ribosomal protein S18]-alanine N-acetyltransferase